MAVLDSWNYKEINEFYARVRALLDNLSEASLPNEYIDMPEKAPYAEFYAKSKVTNWTDLDEPNFKIFESAIVYKTASLFESLVQANSIKKQELPTMTLEYFQRNELKFNGLSLSELANALLDELAGTTGIDFSIFEVTN